MERIDAGGNDGPINADENEADALIKPKLIA